MKQDDKFSRTIDNILESGHWGIYNGKQNDLSLFVDPMSRYNKQKLVPVSAELKRQTRGSKRKAICHKIKPNA